jgi:hypothetical protein
MAGQPASFEHPKRNRRSLHYAQRLALYQGTTLVVLSKAQRDPGFSPCQLLLGQKEHRG